MGAQFAASASVQPAIPSASGVYTACYDSSGYVRLIDATASCPKGWSGPVTWNQKGPKGDTGPQGVPGTPGINGANGASVVSATEPAGANCPYGGSSFTVQGVTTYACNGAPGPQGAPADPIINGCFQVAGLTTGWETFEAGSTQIDGWTVGGDSVDVNSSEQFEPPPGCGYSVDLAGNAEGSVSQVVPTSPGTKYQLRWALAGNPENLPVVKTMKVYWDGQLAGTYTFDTTGDSDTSMGWVTEQLQLTASGPTSTVEFADASGATMNGSCIGDVSLTPLPN